MAIERKETTRGVRYKSVFTYYVTKNGKAQKQRISKTFDKKSEALKWEAEQKLTQENTKTSGVVSSLGIDCTFQEYAHNWHLKNAGKVTPETSEEYRSKIDNKMTPFFGEKKSIAKISVSECEDFCVYLRQLDFKPKTINMYITLLKQIFKDAYEKEYIKSNPTKLITLLKVDERDFDYWEVSEIETFIKKAKSWHFYDFALVALNTGMRLGEIADLRPKDINFETNFIRVSTTAKKKGRVGTTKSKKIRMVPMNKRVRSILNTRVKNLSKDDLIFTYNDRVINITHFTDRYWRPTLYKNELRLIRFHDLRHTFASHFMMNEGNIFTLQKILGHSDIKETMRYAHLSPSHLQDAIGIVNF